jgi:hypothetical protein
MDNAFLFLLAGFGLGVALAAHLFRKPLLNRLNPVINQAILDAYNLAIEDAARLADLEIYQWHDLDPTPDIASTIRRLKKEPLV